MSNPALTEQAFADARADELEAGWAVPPGTQRQAGPPSAAPYTGAPAPAFGPRADSGAPPRPPLSHSPVSQWPPSTPAGYKAMRVNGVASATGVLLALLVAAGWFGYQAVTIVTGTNAAGETVVTNTTIPPWLFLSWFVGLGIAILTVFKPKIARVTAPLYAIAEGLLVGGISHLFEVQYDGIILQAVGLTIGVFLVMLGLFAFRIIKVTEKLRMVIFASTGAIFLVYMASMLVNLFGGSVPFIHDAGPLGIGFSLVVVAIASLNLLLDFDLVERGVEAQAPRYMEWYAAFGLLVTLVWLYLELLRLLSKLRQR